MHFSTATAISLFSLSLGVSAATIQNRQINSGFWQIIAKPFGDSSAVGTPVVLGFDPTNENV